ncbi:MAG TPA: DAK2 domain-containing protein [Actinomycetes bacterium]|nr:DAK2 domain-containing protein [Actinomycetes bacterium]
MTSVLPFRAADVRRAAEAALAALGRTRAEIDSLNVYPVPDRDTGTNLYLTAEAVLAALPEGAETVDAAEALRAAVRGALLGARGSSGVIVSQLLRGAVEGLSEGGPAVEAVRRALRRASDAAWAAVAAPVEGTVLSVAAAVAKAAESVQADDPLRVLAEAVREAHEALARTPEQMELLRAAGVVDSGARGLVVLLDSLLETVSGVAPPPVSAREEARPPALPRPAHDLLPEGGPAFEVMYLLEADDDAVEALREQLAGLGDSLLVVGGEGLWNVHIHVDDVGAAVEAGIRAGRPYRIAVTHFGDQRARAAVRPAGGHRVVAISAGPGMTSLLERAGAVVVPAPPGRRPSSAEMLEAVRRTGAADVILLPHHRDLLPVAEAAAVEARADGIRVAVVPTTAAVQVLSALAVHDPGRAFGEDVVAMTAAARATRHGGVTVSTREALTMAGVCRPGDVLGLLGGDIGEVRPAADATEREEAVALVAQDVLDRLLGPGGELVTLVLGEEAEASLGSRLQGYLAARHPEVDVTVVEGGQPLYLLLVGVE